MNVFALIVRYLSNVFYFISPQKSTFKPVKTNCTKTQIFAQKLLTKEKIYSIILKSSAG